MQPPSFQGQPDYVERTARMVPGLSDMHRMAGILLGERVPDAGRVLVLGAGGGIELRAFAQMHPGWRFDGVDPSPDMLDLARTTLGPLTDRVAFHDGLIDFAPMGPFDGATCLLTLHFLPEAERVQTLRDLYSRLKPGAPLVVAHHSFPNSDGEKETWLTRFARFAGMDGPTDGAAINISAMKDRLPVLSPAGDEAALTAAGFVDITLFYAALTFRGWIAYRPT